MSDLPNQLALTSIADSSEIVASTHRNNYNAIQTAVNAIISALSGGSAGQLFKALSSSSVDWENSSSSGAGTELDYKQVTSAPTAISATTESGADTVIDGNAVTYDGSRVKLEFYTPKLTATGQTHLTIVFLCDSTVVGQSLIEIPPSSTPNGYAVAFHTPSAASHTYKAHAFVSANTVTVGAGAGGAGELVPAFLRVTTA